ncbi:hypothetical protein PTTG_28672 [Puccinia triticina 1-1 BBBD Race 1]|uniref:Uncharacterized protein n=1 Tax=Puccinia triticina (isolate 1-1 / race 1 (BBBD)) TaxID=630390 RepID=A0A180GAY7_PUCT1|nr:hypothetical protein PTTG_28672 [Puccinia triticina 1-1 BBBD Race 1]
MITSPKDFRAFVDACHANPLRKVLVKVLMADPAKVVKALEVPNANVVEGKRLAERIQICAELQLYLKGKYGGNDESLQIKNPADPATSILVTRDGLRCWSRCLLHELEGVDFDHPPDVPDLFTKDPRPAPTLAELAAKQTARLDAHRSVGKRAPSSVSSGPPILPGASHSKVGSPLNQGHLAADPAIPSKFTEPGKASSIFTPPRRASWRLQRPRGVQDLNPVYKTQRYLSHWPPLRVAEHRPQRPTQQPLPRPCATQLLCGRPHWSLKQTS